MCGVVDKFPPFSSASDARDVPVYPVRMEALDVEFAVGEEVPLGRLDPRVNHCQKDLPEVVVGLPKSGPCLNGLGCDLCCECASTLAAEGHEEFEPGSALRVAVYLLPLGSIDEVAHHDGGAI